MAATKHNQPKKNGNGTVWWLRYITSVSTQHHWYYILEKDIFIIIIIMAV